MWLFNSSIGRKVVMSVTGIALILFLTFHGCNLYRPSRLKKDLSSPEAVSILSGKGYSCDDPDRCLAQLVEHLRDDKEFPHEIGLFLGYPPEDVRSFMKSPCQGVKCVGCWKAYSNKEEAEKTFERFQKCTEIYKKGKE